RGHRCRAGSNFCAGRKCGLQALPLRPLMALVATVSRQVAAIDNRLAIDARVRTGVLLVLTLGLGAVLFGRLHMLNPLTEDSGPYIDFDRIRTVGYPLFLALFRWAALDFSVVVAAQFLLLCAAT